MAPSLSLQHTPPHTQVQYEPYTQSSALVLIKNIRPHRKNIK